MKRLLRDQGLSLFFFALFAAALIGQSIAGHAEFNDEAVAHGSATLSYWSYVVSSDFGQAVMENWQSEYLQFTLFVFATVWFVQKGSPESKKVDEVGTQTDAEQQVAARDGGLGLFLYSNSLLILMAAIWIGSWLAQSLTGMNAFNEQALEHDEATLGWLQYVGTADFWESTLENWQSEFLAVGSMVVFSIYLRQRGSPESKPVGASNEATGIES